MSSPFLAHEWLEAWWKGYCSEVDRMQVVCVRESPSGELLGVLPAYTHGKRGALSPCRLVFMGDALGATQLDCLVDPRYEADVIEALRGWLVSNRQRWDVLAFRRMRHESPFLAMLIGLKSCGVSSRVTVSDSVACPEVLLSPTWEEHLQKLSRRERRRITRWRQDLESVGTVAVERIEQPEDLPAALADVLRMFEQGMSTRYERPYEASARYKIFLRSVSEAFLVRGWLQLLFLTVDGERVAFVWQVKHGHDMIGYKTAYDESWAPYHVGHVIFGYSFEYAIDEGCSAFNLGVGVSSYKLRFTKNVAQMKQATCYGRSPAGRLASAREASRRALVARIKRHAPASIVRRMERASEFENLNRL